MTNIEHFEFNYAAESAKVEFQGNVSGLLELQQIFAAKVNSAREKNKEGAFFTIGELEVFQDWLMRTTTALLESYSVIDHTNRVTNKLYHALAKAEDHRRRLPKLKDIAA